ncbi:phosphoribosyl 1,2-cyclic phosphodiesterase [Geomicrobium halophilum]|uniref:Phosphoribosyl 1,2-cyclic phosphodiesterase n=1 Tax=Geomicrobium halophilum TaxID=549000 RepID=A0A841PRY5_9BACL|nr:MBL fold metallo-hydrolase [Geomicrobium halophilum]MBB6450564.1 phosphoribosyl 1,2-cyclic phosphodiesterase [Geomicrobium halophilum]
MGIAFSVLASGSTGNAMYIETNQTRLLIDAGLSGKKIEKMFQHIDRSLHDIDGLLVSHEHSDHVKGVGVLARKYQLPIYANERTWDRMSGDIGPVDSGQRFHLETGTVQTFSDLDVETFGVSHDAADPMFFVFHHEKRKVALATDMGYVSERIKGTIAGADALVFESNHDMNMLRMGRYPWNVKRRILGDTGHVSNDDAAKALLSIIGEQTKFVYLAHLSQDNNLKELARMTIEQTMEENDVDSTHNGIQIRDTDPYLPTPIQKVL